MAAASVRRGRLALIILAILFLGPLILAYASYYGGWRPGGQVQKGHLVDPVKTLPEIMLYDSDGKGLSQDLLHADRWTMLYVGSSDCQSDCRRTLYNMRQVWKSLHRRSKRVKGVYVATDRVSQKALETFIAEEHGGLHLTYANPDEGLAQSFQWRDFFHGEQGAPEGANVYLIDPLGNWMLYYTPKDSAKGMLTDIKKLLRLSNIG